MHQDIGLDVVVEGGDEGVIINPKRMVRVGGRESAKKVKHTRSEDRKHLDQIHADLKEKLKPAKAI